MNRQKHFAIGTVLTLGILSGATTVWYQSHYVAPYAPPPAQVLPSPNGFDTLYGAMAIQATSRMDLLFPSYRKAFGKYPKRSLAEGQKILAANQPCLAKTREVFTQEYLVPHNAGIDLDRYGDHTTLLMFAAQTYEIEGNLIESLRCALDAMELGVMVPRGGNLMARKVGSYYESQGREKAWQVAASVDAKTARQAAARLETMEERRWALPESLREELLQKQITPRLREFEDGPIFAWEAMKLASGPEEIDIDGDSELDSKTPRGFWDRVKSVYDGPKPLVDSSEKWIQLAQERLNQPWNPKRPPLYSGSLSKSMPNCLNRYPKDELDEYFHRTQSTLLRTSLALRAYTLEHGAPPESLDILVSAGYLKTVPIDPFSPTHAPLRYRVNDKTYMLWSVGPDTKDDGGKPVVSPTGDTKYRESIRADSLGDLPA